MEWELRLEDPGVRQKTLRALRLALDSLDLPIQVDEIRDEGEHLVVDFDVDLDSLLRAAVMSAFRRTPWGQRFADSIVVGKAKPRKRSRQGGRFKEDDPKTPDTNEAWVGGKAPAKKKS